MLVEIDDNKRWVPSHLHFIESIIDSVIYQELKIPGIILKSLFDEYQKGVKIRNKYTRFYSEYVIGDDKHRPICDEKYYTLEINESNDIIARRVTKKMYNMDIQLNPYYTDINTKEEDEIYD